MSSFSLPNDLHQHPLPPAPVELPVEDLFPGPEVQQPFGDCHHYLAPHDLPLDVRIGIVFPCVVPVLADRLVRGELFQPLFVVMVQAGFIIVDEDRGRDVHRIYQAQLLADSALFDACLHLRRDVFQRVTNTSTSSLLPR